MSRNGAFSLIEVVLAVGVFALATVALIGLGSLLLRDAGRAEGQVELESFLRDLERWLDEIAADDYTRVLEMVNDGEPLYAWNLRSMEGGVAGWTFGSIERLDAARSASLADSAWMGPVAVEVRFAVVAHPGDQPSPNYQPVGMELRMAGLPPPGASASILRERLDRLPPSYDVRTVVFR